MTKLPEGLLVDASWLRRHGYSSQLQHSYVASGWLVQPARAVFRRPRGNLSWQQVVISLQTILNYSPLIVGGRTAIELHGYAHYMKTHMREVHLFGPEPPPGWLSRLPIEAKFHYHNSERLFRNDPVAKGLTSLKSNIETGGFFDLTRFQGIDGLAQFEWGQRDWPLTLSSPERAVLELLDELPNHEVFDQVDAIFDGLANLRPKLLQKLLVDCKSVKVKRLFMYFADRHNHAWQRYLDKDAIDLGSGKRALVKGGVLDPTYQITVPGDFNGLR